jgi:hypothetical protein
VEVTGPDFGPVRNLPLSGTLRVPATQSTVFQLNAYYEDQLITSATQELTVLEPTPTPEPPPTDTPLPPPTDTPTPTPAPQVVFFSISDPTNTGAVIPIGSENDVPVYEVRAGAIVRIAWNVINPVSQVRLRDLTTDYGTRFPQDEFQTQIFRGTDFRLDIIGAESTTPDETRVIRIVVPPIQPPPPPQFVSGIDGIDEDSPSTVTWEYPGQHQSRILGFRIYRASIESFNFSIVANYFTLTPEMTEWIDPTIPSCDRVYYVVAVFEDITQLGDEQIRETAPSAESWYTKPCLDTEP